MENVSKQVLTSIIVNHRGYLYSQHISDYDGRLTTFNHFNMATSNHDLDGKHSDKLGMATVGVWEPTQAPKLSWQKLTSYVDLCQSLDLEQLNQGMPAQWQQTDQFLMKLTTTDWCLAKQLDDDQIILLIRFFTLVEMQLPGWEAGKTSPVIYLVKILKSRSVFTDELRKWIKHNTDNRYLPNGAILL